MGACHEFNGNQFLDEVSLTEQPSGSVMNVVDQEEIDPPEDTTMLIWDPDLIMPSDDLFESQEPPAEVSVVQTRSKGPPISKDPITTQTSGESQLSITQKNLFLPVRTLLASIPENRPNWITNS
jgi:hypothetical protein